MKCEYRPIKTADRRSADPGSPTRRFDMAHKLLTGSFVALLTPFNDDGSIDYDAFRTLLDFPRPHGTSAAPIMASTGEPSMPTPE